MATEKAGVAGVAGRYATALFELADERKALELVEADLKSLRTMLTDSEDFQRFVASPILSRESQLKGIAAIAAAAACSDLTTRFLGLVATNRRLFAIPAMISAFFAKLAARRGEVQATVVAARPLSEAQRAALASALTSTAGANVAIDVRVDPAILGGMVVRVGSRMIDSSLRTKLERLQLSMKGVG
ncbi:MAG: F0F1 ATP synthase subunit delta [Alphaproteobacteria bacterium]